MVTINSVLPEWVWELDWDQPYEHPALYLPQPTAGHPGDARHGACGAWQGWVMSSVGSDCRGLRDTSFTTSLAATARKTGTVVVTCAGSPKVASRITGKVAMRYYY